MTESNLPNLLLDAFDDLDRVLHNLSSEDAVRHVDGSSFAWTVAHLANQVDAWTNVRIQGLDPHPLISQQRFRFGGPGEAEDWDAIQTGVVEVRAAATAYLDRVTDADLNRVHPYEGSVESLKDTGITLRYALSRTIAHHYFHIGEIASKRDRLGHSVGDYPGLLSHSIPRP
jgi:hypothetical protein